MTDTPQPPPGWQPPPPPTSPPPPPAPQPGWAPPPPPSSTLPPPPGTPGYGYGYAPQGGGGQAKSLSGVATALWILLIVVAVAALAVAGALNNRATVLDDSGASFQDVTDSDDLAAGTAVIYILAFIATVVLWLIWQYRFAKNAEVLGKREGLGAGWAIGGWLIPIANLILGPLQLYQSAKWSDPESPGRPGRVPGLVIAWWVLWVGQGLIGFGSGRFGFSTEAGNDVDIDEFRASDQLGSFGAVVTAAAAIVAIFMIRELTRRQREALAARGMTV